MSDGLLILLGLVAIPLLMYLNPTDDDTMDALTGLAVLLPLAQLFRSLFRAIFSGAHFAVRFFAR